jgi:hypothetical protein
MEEQKDRFENAEPETDDVEGHRLKDDPERKADRNVGEPELNELERNAGEPDVEAHQLLERNMDRNADRNADRNIDRNADRNAD